MSSNDLAAQNRRLREMIDDLATSGERTRKALAALVAEIEARIIDEAPRGWWGAHDGCSTCTAGTAPGAFECTLHMAATLLRGRV